MCHHLLGHSSLDWHECSLIHSFWSRSLPLCLCFVPMPMLLWCMEKGTQLLRGDTGLCQNWDLSFTAAIWQRIPLTYVISLYLALKTIWLRLERTPDSKRTSNESQKQAACFTAGRKQWKATCSTFSQEALIPQGLSWQKSIPGTHEKGLRGRKSKVKGPVLTPCWHRNCASQRC